MIIWQYQGKASDVVPGLVSASGTGQSGNVVINTTPPNVHTNAQALAFTCNTSSGDGTTALYVQPPLRPSLEKVRLSCVFNNANTDANLDFILFHYVVYYDTYYIVFELAVASEYGATEKITYLNSANSRIDTGFQYRPQNTATDNYWDRFVMDIDLTNKQYTRLVYQQEIDMTAKLGYEVTTAAVPHQLLYIALKGDDTISQVYFDSITLEDIS